jgi:tetratricopeptide (TPR) repeat protein
LVVAVLLVYQPAWHGGFIWDDDAHVTKPELRSWQGLYRIWSDVRATLQYYPLLHSAFWIEHKLWGDTTLGYHLVNLLLHATAAVMVALILRRLAVPGAYLAAAIFAVHPVHVESVAWITEQKNTLSAVFYLGAMLLYLHFDETRKISWYLGALALFVLGLLSKTVIGTLPGALLVIFWWQRGRLSWQKDVLPLVPFFLLGAGGGMITAWWEINLNRCVGPDYDLTLVQRFLIAGRAVWFYLWKLFWPARLTFIYPRWQIDSGQWWQHLFLLGAAGLLALLWAIRRWSRAPLAALLFFAGTLFPVLGFFNLYASRYSFVANHYQYLASLGPIILAAAGAALLFARWQPRPRWVGYAVCLVILATLAGLTWRQSEMYGHIETLYERTIAENPDCWMAHNNLGNALANRGRIDEAMAQYRKVLEIKPDHAEAHYNLGNALAKGGRFDEAMAQYRKALEIKPDHAEAHNNLGTAFVRLGRFDEAMAQYRKALEIKPNYAEAHYNLGTAFAGLGRFDEAVAQYRKALEIKPDYAEAHNNLGSAFVRLGRFDEAIAHYQKAVEIKPNYAEGHNNLAWLRATCPQASLRNDAEAIAHAQRANQLCGSRRPDVLNTLAAAYAEAGRFPEALATARKALDLATQQHGQPLADVLRSRIRLYEAGKPYRQPPSASAPPPQP